MFVSVPCPHCRSRISHVGAYVRHIARCAESTEEERRYYRQRRTWPQSTQRYRYAALRADLTARVHILRREGITDQVVAKRLGRHPSEIARVPRETRCACGSSDVARGERQCDPCLAAEKARIEEEIEGARRETRTKSLARR
jgi:hypothetical protein